MSAQGLGCMNLTGPAWAYGRPVDENVAIATIQRALDLGITLLDTANVYGPRTNEELVGRVIRGRRNQVVISTKFGVVTRYEPVETPYRGDRPYVRQCIEGSLRRLGVDYIDLYLCHRVDSLVPLEETVGAMGELVEEGKVGHIGLCEVTPEQLRLASAVHPIAVIQSEWSLWSRDIEDEVLGVARDLGIGIAAYAPLGRGFLSGAIKSPDDLPADDVFRRSNPRFQGENFKKNLELVARVEEVAKEKGCTPAQLALAWLHSRGPDIVPIPGADRPEYVVENVGALSVRLSEDDLIRLEAAIPRHAVSGSRYPTPNGQKALSDTNTAR